MVSKRYTVSSTKERRPQTVRLRDANCEQVTSPAQTCPGVPRGRRSSPGDFPPYGSRSQKTGLGRIWSDFIKNKNYLFWKTSRESLNVIISNWHHFTCKNHLKTMGVGTRKRHGRVWWGRGRGGEDADEYQNPQGLRVRLWENKSWMLCFGEE